MEVVNYYYKRSLTIHEMTQKILLEYYIQISLDRLNYHLEDIVEAIMVYTGVAIDYDLSFYLNTNNLKCFNNMESNCFYLGDDSDVFDLNSVIEFFNYFLVNFNHIEFIDDDEFICTIYHDTIFKYLLHKEKHKKRYYIVVKSIDKSPFIMLK